MKNGNFCYTRANFCRMPLMRMADIPDNFRPKIPNDKVFRQGIIR